MAVHEVVVGGVLIALLLYQVLMVRVLVVAGLLWRGHSVVRALVLLSNTPFGVDHAFVDFVAIDCVPHDGISVPSKTSRLRLTSIAAPKGLRIYLGRV